MPKQELLVLVGSLRWCNGPLAFVASQNPSLSNFESRNASALFTNYIVHVETSACRYIGMSELAYLCTDL